LEKVIEIKKINPVILFGIGDENIKIIENALPVKIIFREELIKIQGEDSLVNQVCNVFYEMINTISQKGTVTNRDIQQLIAMTKTDFKNGVESASNLESVIYFGKKGSITPKTDGQIKYMQTVKNNDVVFSIGPAGTGKTFLSVAFALAALDCHDIDRIILCRPAVEAGESLGFLPGDLKDKVDPYLAPLYDSLRDLYSETKLAQLLESKIVEVVPLAYMRGRTLDNAYMILDEAQNTTALQMKMFLTRLGVGSRAIITGDVTQIDLKNKNDSGLIQASSILSDVEGIGFVNLDKKDIVRHPLVMKIIQAYQKS